MKDYRKGFSARAAEQAADPEIKLFIRRISDGNWAAALRQGTEDVMRRIQQDRRHGLDWEMVKACLTADMDLLRAVIADEFVSRLTGLIANGAGLRLGLRFAGSEPSEGGAMRFLWMTAEVNDLLVIYNWNVSRIDPRHPVTPKGIEEMGHWDWGLYLDSIVRSVAPGEADGVSNYARIFGHMSRDGFIERALLTTLRNFDVFERGSGSDGRTLH